MSSTSSSKSSEAGHFALDLFGLIPVIGEFGDGVNAFWYGVEGDYTNAGLSAGATIPFLGWFSNGGKYGDDVGEIFWEGGAKSTGRFPNANFVSEKQLTNHYQKHVIEQKEFGNISMSEYLQRVKDLINSQPSETILRKTRSNGDELFYNTKTNEFASVTRDGVIRTLFKPKKGIDYWNRQ